MPGETPRASRPLDVVDDGLGLVCNLPPSDRNGRRLGVQDLLKQSVEHHETESGVAIVFPTTTEIAESVLAFVLAERQCCAQFCYSIVFYPDRGNHELLIDGTGKLIGPLKALYTGLAAQVDADG